MEVFFSISLVYKEKDYNGEDIQGTFCFSELQTIDVKEDVIWILGAILKTW